MGNNNLVFIFEKWNNHKTSTKPLQVRKKSQSHMLSLAHRPRSKSTYREQVVQMEQYLDKANKAIVKDFTPEQAASRMNVFADEQEAAAYRQKIEQLWAAADMNQNNYLEKSEYDVFIKFLYDYNQAKHGGTETTPPEILEEGFNLIRELWGEPESPGVKLKEWLACMDWMS